MTTSSPERLLGAPCDAFSPKMLLCSLHWVKRCRTQAPWCAAERSLPWAKWVPGYIFPLPPTPDPNPGDYILGRFAGQMLIGGVQMDLIAYC
jgi:hypothetical protein